MLAAEGLGFGKNGRGFDGCTEHEANAQAALLGGGAQEPVVTDAGEPLVQDVEKPAPDELVGMKSEHSGLAGVAAGPAQQDASGLVVSDESLW